MYILERCPAYKDFRYSKDWKLKWHTGTNISCLSSKGVCPTEGSIKKELTIPIQKCWINMLLFMICWLSGKYPLCVQYSPVPCQMTKWPAYKGFKVTEHSFWYLHRICNFSKTTDPWVTKFCQTSVKRIDYCILIVKVACVSFPW